MFEGSTTCMKPTPGRTWSPSWTSPIFPCFQIVFRTTTPVNRGVDLHEFGIRLGVLHGFACTIPLNFQNANRRLRRLAFQVEGLAKLLQCGLRFVKILLGLFGIDARDDLDLLHFELSFAQTV